jgi:hypothetical protein
LMLDVQYSYFILCRGGGEGGGNITKPVAVLFILGTSHFKVELLRCPLPLVCRHPRHLYSLGLEF